MKLDDSNRRYSNIIVGILVISVASIFLAYALGDWDHNVFSMNNPPQNGVVLFTDKGNNIMENDILCEIGFLSIPEKYCSDELTTEAGKIAVISSIPESLPLSINQDLVNDWALTMYSYGGYSMEDGVLKVYQNKFDESCWFWCNDVVGEIDMSYTTIAIDLDLAVEDLDLNGDGVADQDDVDLYNYLLAEFGLTEFDELDMTTVDFILDDPIILESNDIPVLVGDAGWYLDAVDGWWWWCGDLPEDLDKFVTLKYEMTWEGCWQDEQKFMVILAYNYMRLESLTPD